jgi:hypothetical protein
MYVSSLRANIVSGANVGLLSIVFYLFYCSALKNTIIIKIIILQRKNI